MTLQADTKLDLVIVSSNLHRIQILYLLWGSETAALSDGTNDPDDKRSTVAIGYELDKALRESRTDIAANGGLIAEAAAGLVGTPAIEIAGGDKAAADAIEEAGGFPAFATKSIEHWFVVVDETRSTLANGINSALAGQLPPSPSSVDDDGFLCAASLVAVAIVAITFPKSVKVAPKAVAAAIKYCVLE